MHTFSRLLISAACLLGVAQSVPAQDIINKATPDDLVRSLLPGGGASSGGGRELQPKNSKGGVLFQGSNNQETGNYQNQNTQTYGAEQAPAYGQQQQPTYNNNQATTYQAAPAYEATNSYGDKTYATVNLAVTFRRNSADLTPEARYLLDSVGQALQSNELANYKFLVGGHTDATGSSYTNLELSRLRAESARAYLVQYHNIDPYRLVVRAFGEDALLFPDYPNDGRNRRVEISTLQ